MITIISEVVRAGNINLLREVIQVKVVVKSETLSKSVLMHELQQLLWFTEWTRDQHSNQLISFFMNPSDDLIWQFHIICEWFRYKLPKR